MFRIFPLLLIFAAATPLPAMAWGSAGHRYIGELAAKAYPATVPAFLRSPEAVRQLGEMAREPDRSRNSGQPHDGDLDPGHFIDVLDDGTIMGASKLDALPPNRRDFDTALRAVNSNEYRAGFLPYNIMGGWQQLVKDFTLWRADVAGAKFAKSKADRNWFVMDRKVRETLTLRDLGVWSHFVGGRQPADACDHSL